jgi:hypothetical protein
VQPRSPAPASPGGQQAIAYLVFALIGTLGLGVPVVLDIATLTRAQLLAMLGSGGADGIQFDGDPRTPATITAFTEHAVSAFAIVAP